MYVKKDKPEYVSGIEGDPGSQGHWIFTAHPKYEDIYVISLKNNPQNCL